MADFRKQRQCCKQCATKLTDATNWKFVTAKVLSSSYNTFRLLLPSPLSLFTCSSSTYHVTPPPTPHPPNPSRKKKTPPKAKPNCTQCSNHQNPPVLLLSSPLHSHLKSPQESTSSSIDLPRTNLFASTQKTHFGFPSQKLNKQEGPPPHSKVCNFVSGGLCEHRKNGLFSVQNGQCSIPWPRTLSAWL